MATPLRDVLHAALSDADTRTALERSPGGYLAEHGWQGLDAADLQEAMLILADGAATIEAVTWVTGADAIEATDGGAGQALSAALAAMDAPLIAEDPATLVGFDDVIGESADDPPPAPATDPAGDDDPDGRDGQFDPDDIAARVDLSASGPEVDVTSDEVDIGGEERSSGSLDELDIHDIHIGDIHDIHTGESGAAPSADQYEAPDDDWDGLL